MKIRQMVVVPIAGAMLSAAFVSAQETQTRPQTGNNQPGQAQQGQDQQNQGRKPGQTDQNQQGQRSGQTNTRSGQTGEHTQWQNPDHVMAACVAIDNQEEVALATMLQDKLQHEEAKQFAAMLIKDHQNYLSSLEKFAPGIASQELEHGGAAGQAQGNKNRSGVEQARGEKAANAPGIRQTSGDEKDRDDQNRDTAGNDKNDQNSKNSQHDQSGLPDLVQIQREIAQECLRATREDMQNKQGIDADKAFIGAQIIKHGAMKAKLTVLQRHASDELAQVFAKGAETTEKHKQQAEQIMKKLESSQGGAERRTQPEAQQNQNK